MGAPQGGAVVKAGESFALSAMDLYFAVGRRRRTSWRGVARQRLAGDHAFRGDDRLLRDPIAMSDVRRTTSRT